MIVSCTVIPSTVILYCHLSLLHIIQRRIVNLVGHDLPSSLEALSHRRSASVVFCWLFHLTIPLAALHVFLFVHIHVQYYCPQRRYYEVLIQFLPTRCLTLESLPVSCFPATNNLSQFKRNINSYLSTL